MRDASGYQVGPASSRGFPWGGRRTLKTAAEVEGAKRGSWKDRISEASRSWGYKSDILSGSLQKQRLTASTVRQEISSFKMLNLYQVGSNKKKHAQTIIIECLSIIKCTKNGIKIYRGQRSCLQLLM